jgi:hypothetical protein
LHKLLTDTATPAEFRLIVFRPYIGEALVGKVKSQSPEGIVSESMLYQDETHRFNHNSQTDIAPLVQFRSDSSTTYSSLRP